MTVTHSGPEIELKASKMFGKAPMRGGLNHSMRLKDPQVFVPATRKIYHNHFIPAHLGGALDDLRNGMS